MEKNTTERRQQVRQQQQPQQLAQQCIPRRTGDGSIQTAPKMDAWQSLANAQARRQIGDL